MNTLYIVWNDSYNTGIKILDEQYRGLVSIINSFFFHRMDKDGDIERILVPTAEMFKAYVKINFLTVEKLMKDSHYPKLRKYRAIHRDMIDTIALKEKGFRMARDLDGMLEFVKSYWLDSVQHNQSEYMDYLLDYYRHEI